METNKPWVVVVGAGPAGLLLSLLLARKHIPVLLLDKEDKLDQQPRATHYSAPAVQVLAEVGVAEEMRESGFMPTSICWRKLDGTRLVGLSRVDTANDPDRMICLPLNQLGQILLRRLQVQPSATIHWKHEVVGQGEENGLAWIDVATPKGLQRVYANYVVGCDGANSKVRLLLFGNWEFPGKTRDVQIVATNVSSIFRKVLGGKR